jgi:putative colanic acid biosynthesis UDP-glucose lipid carrier transferase
MRQRIGIYGPTGRSLQLAQLLAASCQGVEIVGLYDGPGGPVLDSRSQGLDRLIADSRSGGIGQIIVALPLEEQEAIRRTVERLAVLPVDVQLCTEISPFPVPVHKTDRLADIAVHLVSPRPLSDRAKLVKAIMDFGIASVGLLLCLPLMAVVTLAVKFADGGPVFFRQRRLGENQRQFVIYKFRTMKVMEDGAFIRQAKENDARVTRIGRFLRRTSLDELPQLINVLRGEMSLVGPRPHAVAHDETFERQLPHYARRHRVKPGITGWAQVNGLRGETKSPDDMRRRMEHDLHYINNWSIGLDLKILLSTVVAVLAGHKAY